MESVNSIISMARVSGTKQECYNRLRAYYPHLLIEKSKNTIRVEEATFAPQVLPTETAWVELYFRNDNRFIGARKYSWGELENMV